MTSIPNSLPSPFYGLRLIEAFRGPGAFVGRALALLGRLALFCGVAALLLAPACPQAAAQTSSGNKIVRIDIKHVGPQAVSDELIRANIRVKVGDEYLPLAINDDVRNLYATGFFYNIRVNRDPTSQGIVLTYVVQGKPRLSEIRFQGNKKYTDAKLRKKLTSKTGEPMDEQKLFSDSQEILKMYQKAGYPRTEVKAVPTVVEETGRAVATFEITESPKVKIVEVDFVGATAFKQKKLRHVIKTRKHWMFSWLTGGGTLKDEQFEDDKEKLAEFYRDHGYIDYELKDVQFVNPTPKTMIIRLIIYEGRQYKVGSIKFTGNKLFSSKDISEGMHQLYAARGGKKKLGPNGLIMDVGDTYTPKGMTTDTEAVEDFYGARGYIDVAQGTRNLIVLRIPNTDTGTMDLEFRIDEGQKSYIEKIEIRGNIRTKDTVVRRELAVSPGEVFDMVRVKLSKQRLQGLDYFEKVDTRSEPTEISPSHKNLLVSVDEKQTGHLMVGAGFSSVDAIVGFAEVNQGNFDLFNPPTFTGGGQKFRLRLQVGSVRQDYLAEFIEPWFLGKKLQLDVSLYYRDWNFQSLNNIYDEIRAGGRVSIERALGNDYLRGSLSYTLEDVGILLNSPYHGWAYQGSLGAGSAPPPTGAGGIGGGLGPGGGQGQTLPPNLPFAILNEVGYHFMPRFGASLAYDPRNGGRPPDKGQRSEIMAELVGGPLGGDRELFKIQATTGWYFRGIKPGHVIELVGRAGLAKSLQSGDIPFYERYFLGGAYSLRGFEYRSIAPREPGYNEPIGGDAFWFGSAEYSLPIIERLRFAFFYDIGNVGVSSYAFNLKDFDDNYGLGLRLNLPIGPLRLDYGIPIHHDPYNGTSGQFQFTVGWERPF